MPGYVDAFKPLLRRPARLSTLVPWRDVADEAFGVLTTKDDGWLCCLRLECPDHGSLSDDAQDAVTLRLNDVWKLLPPGSGVWHHLRRREAPALPCTGDAPLMPALLEAEQLSTLNAPGMSWETQTYVTLYCRPPKTSDATGLARYLRRGTPDVSVGYGLEAFLGDTEQILGLLASVCPTVVRLTDDDLTAYLHSCISVHEHPLALGEGLGLYAATADSGFWPGTVPIIGDFMTKHYVRSLTLSRHLPRDGTANAIFRGLTQLPMAFDVVTRWFPKAQLEAKKVTDKSQVNWLSQRSGWRSSLYELRTGRKPDEVKNTFVSKQGDDADAARDRILSGNYQLGQVTMTFLVRAPTETLRPSVEELAAGNRRLAKLAQVVRAAGCSVVDDPINQTENFVGTWPGAAYANVDSLPMTSLNFATLALSDTPWPGVTWNAHLKTRPLLYVRTEGCLRVGVDTFVGDRGNFLMIGPLGSGKSTALGMFDSAWLLHPQRSLYPFDVGRSNRCVILCHGGQYHDLSSMGLQVMADLDRDEAVDWIFDWLKRRVYASGVAKHPDIETFLWGGLDPTNPSSLRRQMARPRTLTAYVDLLQQGANKIASPAMTNRSDRSKALASVIPLVLGALRPFVQGGAYGHLTDAPVDTLKLGRIHGFELEGLMKRRDAYNAVLEIIFFRLEDQHHGLPTRYLWDEAWHSLNDPMWVEILGARMPSWRRQNKSAGFATQSISQFHHSPLTPLVLDQSQTRFFLPNAQALDDGVRESYLGLQLGREEIERNIVRAQARGQMYWTTTPDRLGHPRRRLIDLSLGPLAQLVCGSNSEEAHAAMDDVLAHYPAEEFAVHWFAHHGFHEASAQVAAALERAHA